MKSENASLTETSITKMKLGIQNQRQKNQPVPFVQEPEGRPTCLDLGKQVVKLYMMKPER